MVILLSSGLNIDCLELKPCFERYDGFKIVDAVPFHSEWRMKVEEWCLEFCVRASSRCVSIVYDKQSRICHYFSVNGMERVTSQTYFNTYNTGIEGEKITKHPRMVYFQVAERQCTGWIPMLTLHPSLFNILQKECRKRLNRKRNGGSNNLRCDKLHRKQK